MATTNLARIDHDLAAFHAHRRVRMDWRSGVYPAPVYVATFADGATVRMSFWSRVGKPWDVERGRALCRRWHRTMTGRGCAMNMGYVEHNGVVQDTFTKPVRKRATAKQLKATLAAIIRLSELPAEQQASEAARLVTEARELIAA